VVAAVLEHREHGDGSGRRRAAGPRKPRGTQIRRWVEDRLRAGEVALALGPGGHADDQTDEDSSASKREGEPD
jgi:hypothetical protein